MPYKQYNMEVNLWSSKASNTSKYKQIHTKNKPKTYKYMPIRGPWRPRVYFWSWVYCTCIVLVFVCIAMYLACIWKNNTCQYNQYNHECIKHVFQPNICINTYLFVFICICMYWYVKEEQWINTYTIQGNTSTYTQIHANTCLYAPYKQCNHAPYKQCNHGQTMAHVLM